MESIILGPEIKVRSQNVKVVLSFGWGTGPLALFSPLGLYAVIMGMIEKRVRSHPLSPLNVLFSSIEVGAELQNRLSMLSGD